MVFLGLWGWWCQPIPSTKTRPNWISKNIPLTLKLLVFFFNPKKMKHCDVPMCHDVPSPSSKSLEENLYKSSHVRIFKAQSLVKRKEKPHVFESLTPKYGKSHLVKGHSRGRFKEPKFPVVSELQKKIQPISSSMLKTAPGNLVYKVPKNTEGWELGSQFVVFGSLVESQPSLVKIPTFQNATVKQHHCGGTKKNNKNILILLSQHMASSKSKFFGNLIFIQTISNEN